jgi:L-Ala-D/L-Glu epimerase
MKSTISLRAQIEKWPLAKPFRIAGYTFSVVELLVVVLETDGCVGRGEAAGVHYLHDTPSAMVRQIQQVREAIEAGISRNSLQSMLPPGGARNALDCALWDLEAKCSGKTIWELSGVAPKTVTTVFTIGIEDTPEEMAEAAANAAMYRRLKMKLDSDRPIERVAAVRAVRPQAELLIDANQAWTFEQLTEFAPKLADMDVKLIEQPLPRGADLKLKGYACPVPLSADESCQHRGELEQASQRYQMINIKLDKAGGLTEALLLADAAKERGMTVQTGCMIGTSLSMAPAFVVAQHCLYVELDGQFLLERDRVPGLRCQNGEIDVPDPRLWG